jgi:hypothetical protein
VGPGGQGAEQQQNQDDQKNGAKHATFSKRAFQDAHKKHRSGVKVPSLAGAGRA